MGRKHGHHSTSRDRSTRGGKRSRAVSEQAKPVRSRGRIVLFGLLFTTLVALGSVSETFVIRAQYDLDMRTQHANASGGEVSPRTTDIVANSVYAYQQFIARTVASVLSGMGLPARVDDTSVRVQASSVQVAIECTGIQATAIFCAGVLAFPCTWRSRGLGLLLGLFGIALLNLLRITLLAYIRGTQADMFDPVHTLLMQGFLIVFVAPIWIVWMLRVNRPVSLAVSTSTTECAATGAAAKAVESD